MPFEAFAKVNFVAKTLVIAEKPSVGRDLASALPGTFDKSEGYLESSDYVITWAVGHLLTLWEPEDYDERFKKWRTADLPSFRRSSSSSRGTGNRRSSST